MAVALKKNVALISENTTKLKSLENILINRLNDSGIDFIRNGSEHNLPGNISLSFKNADGEMLLHRLDLKGICISTGSACDSVNNQISHVLQAINVPEEYARGTIRISFGRENTEEDAENIAAAITSILWR